MHPRYLAVLPLFAGCSREVAVPAPLELRGLHTGDTAAPAVSNTLILLADDVGVDEIGLWSPPSSYPATPNLDALAATGVRFQNAWSATTCSPTRGEILTGRHNQRYGLGDVLWPSVNWTFPANEVTLPDVVPNSAWIGKWHLGVEYNGGHVTSVVGPGTPFTVFHVNPGTIGQEWTSTGAKQTFFSWEWWVQDHFEWVNNYNTTEIVDDTLTTLTTLPEPWVVVVAFDAAHAPYHWPPKGIAGVPVAKVQPRRIPQYQADVQAMDTEIGRLLSSMDHDVLRRTTVVFTGDNGTPSDVSSLPAAKGSIYEGGIHVPLIISGPTVASPGAVSLEPVMLADLLPTAADLAGTPVDAVEAANIDGLSLAPLLRDPADHLARPVVFATEQIPLGFGPFDHYDRTVRDAQWKLVVSWPLGGVAETEELYDLLADPGETTNRMIAPDPAAQAAHDFLRPQLDALVLTPAGTVFN